MARPRAFQRQAALEQATQVFWTKGYAATSILDLTAAMKLSKSSFYGAFGDKHAVFLEALEFYRDHVTSKVRSTINLPTPARQVIRSILGRAVDRILEPDGRRGCFLNNIAVEIGPDDPVAAELCRSGLLLMEDTFEHLVRRAQAEGDISAAHNSRKLACFLNGTINGIMVIGKANPDYRTLRDIVDVAMKAVDWGGH